MTNKIRQKVIFFERQIIQFGQAIEHLRDGYHPPLCPFVALFEKRVGDKMRRSAK
jgi:hypothetical protein